MARESWVVVKNEKTGKVEFIPKGEYVRPRSGDGLQIIKDIEPYQNIAIDGKVIGGRRQHRDMLRAHNCIEMGTEAPRQVTPERVSNKPDMGIINDIKRAMGKL